MQTFIPKSRDFNPQTCIFHRINKQTEEMPISHLNIWTNNATEQSAQKRHRNRFFQQIAMSLRDPCRIQTCNPHIRSVVLYSVELMDHCLFKPTLYKALSQKRVQRYCFFLNRANKNSKKAHSFVFLPLRHSKIQIYPSISDGFYIMPNDIIRYI